MIDSGLLLEIKENTAELVAYYILLQQIREG